MCAVTHHSVLATAVLRFWPSPRVRMPRVIVSDVHSDRLMHSTTNRPMAAISSLKLLLFRRSYRDGRLARVIDAERPARQNALVQTQEQRATISVRSANRHTCHRGVLHLRQLTELLRRSTVRERTDAP